MSWRLLPYQKWSVLDGLKQRHSPGALGCIVTCHLIQSPAGNCRVNGDSHTHSPPICWVPSWACTDLIHSHRCYPNTKMLGHHTQQHPAGHRVYGPRYAQQGDPSNAFSWQKSLLRMLAPPLSLSPGLLRRSTFLSAPTKTAVILEHGPFKIGFLNGNKSTSHVISVIIVFYYLWENTGEGWRINLVFVCK